MSRKAWTRQLLLSVVLVSTPLLGQQFHSRKDIATIAKEAKGAVVSIVMVDAKGQPIAQGSGFVVKGDGLIVTNYHVIKSGVSAVVKLPDGSLFTVDGVMASDEYRDIAVIKARGGNFKTVVLGDSDRLQVGEEVVAIGSPLSLESTVSNGIVSGRRIDEKEVTGTIFDDIGPKRRLLQVTAPISPGSSGGPLFDMAGEVVGITSSHLQGGQNLNFAVPINDAKQLLSELYSKPRHFPDEATEAAGTSPASPAISNDAKRCSDEVNDAAHRMINATQLNSDGNIWDYTSHYEASTHACYMWIHMFNRLVNQNAVVVSYDETVLNLFLSEGNRELANWFFVKALTPPVMSQHKCKIAPIGQDTVSCNSFDEFKRLVEQDFGIRYAGVEQ